MCIYNPEPSYVINKDGLYSCPICGKVFGKIHNVYVGELDTYTLQCPTYRNHCSRKTNIDPLTASAYEPIKDIKYCSVCGSILKHTRYNDWDDYTYLVCPNDKSHISPIKIPTEEIGRLGYHSID